MWLLLASGIDLDAFLIGGDAMGCICPKCKLNNVIPIMYGYPAPEDMEEAEKGNLKLGGREVFIGGGQPDCFCKDCEHEWCVENFLVEDSKDTISLLVKLGML